MPSVVKVMDAVTIANNATNTQKVSCQGFEFAAVEVVHNQTVDLNITASVEDNTARTPTLTPENNVSQTRTGLNATTNGRVYVVQLRKLFKTFTVAVTNKSGAADATVSCWVSLIN